MAGQSRSISKFCILVPLYNEVETLPRLKKEIDAFLEKSPVPATVLLINDGSTDGSGELIESIVSSDPAYHCLHIESNSGLSTALKAGIDYCESDWIGYIDADLQTSPLDFSELLKFLPEYDLVIGIRANRKDRFVKRISSLIANSIRRSMIHDGIEDTGCPLKVGKAVFWKQIPFFRGMHRFIPALVQLVGGSVKQVPVRHFPRMEGKAKYHLSNRLIGPLRDAFAVRWMQRHFIRYKITRRS